MLMIDIILFADGQLSHDPQYIFCIVCLCVFHRTDFQFDEVILAVLHVKAIALAVIALLGHIHDNFVIIIDICLIIVLLTHSCPSLLSTQIFLL